MTIGNSANMDPTLEGEPNFLGIRMGNQYFLGIWWGELFFFTIDRPDLLWKGDIGLSFVRSLLIAVFVQMGDAKFSFTLMQFSNMIFIYSQFRFLTVNGIPQTLLFLQALCVL